VCYFEAWERLAARLEAIGGGSRAPSPSAELGVPVRADVRHGRATYTGWRVAEARLGLGSDSGGPRCALLGATYQGVARRQNHTGATAAADRGWSSILAPKVSACDLPRTHNNSSATLQPSSRMCVCPC